MAQDQNGADVETGSAVEVVQEKTAGLQMGSEPTSPTNGTLSSSITKLPNESDACKFGLIHSKII